jgi:hypothetical protein
MHLKALGLPMEALKHEQIPAAMKALTDPKAAPIYFDFRTWKPDAETIEQLQSGKWGYFKGGRLVVGKDKYPSKEAAEKAHPFAGRDPKVVHFWGSACPFNEDQTPGQGMEDNGTPSTEPTPEEQDAALATQPATTAQRSPRKVPAQAAPNGDRRIMAPVAAPEPEAPTFDDGARLPDEKPQDYDGSSPEDADIDTLLGEALSGDDAAQNRLRSIAGDLGWTEEDLDNAKDWPAVAEMAKAGPPQNGEAGAEAPPPAEWEAGQTCYITGTNPKTKQPERIKCEVMEVDLDNRQAVLKNLKTAQILTGPNRKYLPISFDRMEAE